MKEEAREAYERLQKLMERNQHTGAIGARENDFPCTNRHNQESHRRDEEQRSALKYERGGALLQETEVRGYDPDDPDVEILANVLFGCDRIERLSVVIRKGKAEKEIRLIG